MKLQPHAPQQQDKTLLSIASKASIVITVGDGDRKQELVAETVLDEQGNPTGGKTTGVGLVITWQNGPLVVDGKRQKPNGAFVESVVAAAIARLQFLNTASDGRFQCEDNEEAIKHLLAAMESLAQRTGKRQRRRIEGTHIP